MAMQMNRTGVFLLAFFGLFGLAMIVAPIHGEAGWILKSIGAIWILVTLGLLVFARRQKRKAAHQDWVFQNGSEGLGDGARRLQPRDRQRDAADQADP